MVAGGLLVLASAPALSQSWTIENGHISRTLKYTAQSGLYTTQLTNVETNQDLITAGTSPQKYSSEFAVDCDGRTLTGSSKAFQLLGASTDRAGRQQTLTIRLRAVDAPLDIDVLYQVYDGLPGLRKSLVVRNTGPVPVRLTHLKMESVGLDLGPSSEVLLDAQFGGTPRETLYTGRWEDVGPRVWNGRTGDGIAILNEAPGYMKRTEIDAFYHPGHAFITSMYDTDLMPFEREVAAGEEFRSAASSLVLFRKGGGVSDPQWVLPSYTAAVLQRKIGPVGAPWIYNTWNPFRRGINAEIVASLIPIAGQMGMDIFTIDDGWQQQYGENTPDPKAFPHGLQTLRAAVEKNGMRLGLWLPMATIGRETADFRDHPEWAALDSAGKPKETETADGSKIVMCMAGPYQERAASRINEAIEQFHLAYVKLDLTTVFNAYGEAPGCWPHDHGHDGWAESLGRIYEGIDAVTRQVYAKHPDVLIDLSFELWGQKHLIDAGLLTYADFDWLSNVNDDTPESAGPRQARMLLYHRSFAIPADTMIVGNMQADVPDKEEIFATEIATAPLLLGDLRKLSAADRLWYRDHIAWFKKLRSASSLSDSFFPLGNWKQPSPADWDGFARVSKSGTGVLVVFRNESGTESVDVTVPDLPDAKYSLVSAMSGKKLNVINTQLGKLHVRLEFSPGQLVEVLELQPAK
jgi:alpha-galactosidase